MGGESLPMVGKILSLTYAQTTARYVHLDDDPLQSESVSDGEALLSRRPWTDSVRDRRDTERSCFREPILQPGW